MVLKFGMIGGGVMGEALISRLLAARVYDSSEVIVSDPLPDRRSYLNQQYGIQVTADNQAVLGADVLLLAIKPQMFHQVVAELGVGPSERSSQVGVVISILAGTTIAQLETGFPTVPVIRAMPNTPATVGAGMTAIAAGQYAQPDHVAQAETIFRAVGSVVTVPESMMDAVTGLSGSGPGFVALVLEALMDGGVAAGLPRPIASQLALQTVKGTVELLQQSNLHPGELKDRVTSPGGTTIAGIAELERAGLRSALIEAVRAAYRRSQELGS